jgi:hypothetical protein
VNRRVWIALLLVPLSVALVGWGERLAYLTLGGHP